MPIRRPSIRHLHPKDRPMDPRVSEWTIVALARLISTYAVLQGAGILLSNDARFGGASYTAALEFPGAPESWGITLLCLGAFSLFGSLMGNLRSVVFGLLSMSVWSGFFGVALGLAVLRNPTAGTTGMFVYATMMIICAVLASAYRQRV